MSISANRRAAHLSLDYGLGPNSSLRGCWWGCLTAFPWRELHKMARRSSWHSSHNQYPTLSATNVAHMVWRHIRLGIDEATNPMHTRPAELLQPTVCRHHLFSNGPDTSPWFSHPFHLVYMKENRQQHCLSPQTTDISSSV